jgi:hypothetical protein
LIFALIIIFLKMDFVKGDRVVYNPILPDLLPARHRPRDWGIIDEISENYLYVIFEHANYRGQIIKTFCTHAPTSQKYYKKIFDNILKNIKSIVSNLEKLRLQKMYKNCLDEILLGYCKKIYCLAYALEP